MTDADTDLAASQTHPPLHRNRDFLILWSSQVVSTVGTRITSVAYPLLVLAVTQSPVAAGLVGFAQTLPFLLLYLPAGVVVDRWPRKSIMLTAEAVRSIALGIVAASIVFGWVSVPLLAVVAFIEGSCFVFFDLCEGAALPHLVADEQLPAAIAQNQARMQGADLVGQPLGGILYSLGPVVPFAVDAASYLVSFGAVLLLRRPLEETREPTSSRLVDDVKNGLRGVWRQPFLRASIVAVAGLNFASAGLILSLIVRAQYLGASPVAIGMMLAAFGFGALLGAVAATRIQARLGARGVLVGITWLWVVQHALLPFLPDIVSIATAVAIGAFFGPVFNVVLGSVVYRVTPDRLLGRVRSVGRVVAWGTIPLGPLVAGASLSAVGAQATLAGIAGVMLVVAVAATFSRGMRELPASQPS